MINVLQKAILMLIESIDDRRRTNIDRNRREYLLDQICKIDEHDFAMDMGLPFAYTIA